CRVAVKSGRPTHFVHLLRLIQDKDKQVAETAFKTVSDISKTDLGLILDCSLSSPDTWLLENIAPFLPLLITEELRWIVSKVQYHKHPLVGAKAKETINKLNAEMNKILILADEAKRKAKQEEEETAKKLAEEEAERNIEDWEKELRSVTQDDLTEFEQ